MGSRRTVVVVLLLVISDGTLSSGAAEIPVVGKKLILLDKLASAGAAKVVYVSKDPEAGITKGTGTDTGTIGATFYVGYLGVGNTAAGRFSMLPGTFDGDSGWLVNKPAVAKFVNKLDPPGGVPTGVKVAVIKPGKLLKIVGKTLGDDPIDILAAGPPTGEVFTAYCVINEGVESCHCTAFNNCIFKSVSKGSGAKVSCKTSTGDAACASTIPVATWGAFLWGAAKWGVQ
jgi:hypothetical protein